MVSMKRIALLLLGSLYLYSCTTDPIVDEDVEDGPQVGDVTNIETLFEEKAFPDPIHRKLLLELGICDSLPIEITGCVECTPRNFKLFQYKPKEKIEDAFMLQIKAETILKGENLPLPIRHLLVFEREEGQLVKVNGFRGNLIAMRESASGVKDLIVRFYVAEDDVFLNCLFVWKDKKYSFVSVEAIHGAGGNGPVKAEFKDSISTMVYQSLMSNGMLF